MTTFAVWAPNARHVDLVVGADDRIPMSRTENDWWRVDADVAAAVEYRFSLDGGNPLADPRSAWQPTGVNGPSRHVDHEAFDWRCQAWPNHDLLGSVIYELHVGTFTPDGTFDAAIGRLDHLSSLGVDFVELLPVAAFPGRRGWGYDGVFPYSVQDSYAGPDGLKRFIDACHVRGLRVILDVVYNHLGPDGNVLAQYGPYFTQTFSTPWGIGVNFGEADSDEVRRYFVDNALMWLRDYRVDALRLDAVHAIVDPSATHILEELAIAVGNLSAALGRPLWLIAESDLNDPRVICDRSVGGYGLAAQWSDDFHHALHAVLTGERFGYYKDFGSLTDVASALSQGFVYTGQHSTYRRRRHGRSLPPSVPATRLLGYAQTHDQVGNRARGDRLAALVSTDAARFAAALVLLSPFTPMLFMGEEWAASTPWQYFTAHENLELAQAVGPGRCEEFKAFGWSAADVPDPQAIETMRCSILDWDELSNPTHDDMLRWYRKLITFRRAHPIFSSGRFPDAWADENASVLRVDYGPLVMIANFAEAERAVVVDATELLLSSAFAHFENGTLTLAPMSMAMLARATSSG